MRQRRSFLRRTTNIKAPDGSRVIGTALDRDGPVYPVVTRNATYTGEATILGTPYYTQYSPITDAANRVIGILYVGVRRASFEQEISAIRQAVALTGGIVCLVLAGAALLLTRFGLRPLRRIDDATRQLGSGTLQLTQADLERRDEIGDIARALAKFDENAARLAQLQAAQRQEGLEVAQRRHAEMQALAAGFEGTVKKVVDEVLRSSQELQHSSDALSLTAKDATATTTRVAGQAQEAANNISAVAGASEELSTAVAGIARQATRSASKAQEAEQRSGETQAVVRTLADSADRIGEVVTMISTIAAQTNLLALNATIEAARAGEAGRGFSIVASEVKTLAAETTKATQEISQQIQGIQTATGDAVAAIGAIGKTIEEISAIAGAIAAAVEEQRAVVGEISRSTTETASATKAVSANIDTVRKSAETTAASAEQSRNSADSLSRQADVLETEVGRFLATVRAA